MADFLDDFHHKAQPVFQAAAVLVIALVGAFPEELIQQVAVGAVDLDAVKTQRLGILGGIPEGLDDILDVFLAHGLAVGLARCKQAGGAVTGNRRIRLCAFLPYGPDVP